MRDRKKLLTLSRKQITSRLSTKNLRTVASKIQMLEWTRFMSVQKALFGPLLGNRGCYGKFLKNESRGPLHTY